MAEREGEADIEDDQQIAAVEDDPLDDRLNGVSSDSSEAAARNRLIFSDMFTVFAVASAGRVHPQDQVAHRNHPRHAGDGIEQEFEHRARPSGRIATAARMTSSDIDRDDAQKHEDADKFLPTHAHGGA